MLDDADVVKVTDKDKAVDHFILDMTDWTEQQIVTKSEIYLYQIKKSRHIDEIKGGIDNKNATEHSTIATDDISTL